MNSAEILIHQFSREIKKGRGMRSHKAKKYSDKIFKKGAYTFFLA